MSEKLPSNFHQPGIGFILPLTAVFIMLLCGYVCDKIDLLLYSYAFYHRPTSSLLSTALSADNSFVLNNMTYTASVACLILWGLKLASSLDIYAPYGGNLTLNATHNNPSPSYVRWFYYDKNLAVGSCAAGWTR